MDNATLSQNWARVCELAASYPDVDGPQFTAAAGRLVPQAMSDGFLMLTAGNSFVKSWVERSFSAAIARALEDAFGMPFTVVIEVDASSNPGMQAVEAPVAAPSVSAPATSERVTASDAPVAPVAAASSPAALPADSAASEISPAAAAAPVPANAQASQVQPVPQTSSQANAVSTREEGAAPSLKFENFVIGESNRMAYSLAVQVAEMPGMTALNPLFIYGKSGLGKTHLMRAIQNYVHETQPYLNTIYADSEELISGYADAGAVHEREKSSYKNFKTHYEAADVLLIDDIQFLQGKKQTLDIVFQIFNKLINQGKQIVLSADRAPKNIDIDERYSSRFVQGGTIDIQPPEIETKLAIVKSYVNEYLRTQIGEGIYIPEDVQMYIAENSSSNIRELKGAVNIVIHTINMNGAETMDISEARTVLENQFFGGIRKNLTVEDVQSKVEDFFKVKHADLVGTSRSRGVSYPRHIAIYLCRQLLDLPFNDIGKKFNRDHSTAMHSVTRVEEMLLTNRDVQEEIEALKKIIKES